MRITSKGQVTIPEPIRKKTGLLPGTEVEFDVTNGKVVVTKAKGRRVRGKALVEAMRGKATVRMSTDQIMRLTRGEE